MGKYTVEIKQKLTGHIDIQANDIEEAKRIAYQRFVENGEELPDMDDGDKLEFNVCDYNNNIKKEENVRILNVLIEDRSSLKTDIKWIESFLIHERITQPEVALRNAIQDFIESGTEESKNALEYAAGGFNWGDAISSVSDSYFEKHGLTHLNQNSIDVFVDHDEVLCN